MASIKVETTPIVTVVMSLHDYEVLKEKAKSEKKSETFEMALRHIVEYKHILKENLEDPQRGAYTDVRLIEIIEIATKALNEATK